MEYFLSRFAFIFLIYIVITTGYVSEVLSCQMRKFLLEYKMFHHVLGILMVFVFIMLEGGWSFDPKIDADGNNNWSSGNVIETFAISLAIYSIFLLSAKSRLIPNILFYIFVFIIYMINTQRNFWHSRKMITDEENTKILKIGKILFMIAITILFIGFIDYLIYQQKEYGRNFQWNLFILGTSKCTSFEK